MVVLKNSDNLSKTLQSPKMNASEGQHITDMTCQTQEKIRNEWCFDSFTLLKLIMVLPATNAVSERCALALKCVKNCLRTTMSLTRLNNLINDFAYP